MQTCPFCKAPLDEEATSCETCGYSLVLPLPLPVLRRRKLYLVLSILSIILGLLACVLTYVPSLYMKSLFLIIGALGLAGFALEKAWGKPDALAIRFLAVVGLFFGLLGYMFFMFIHSNVPGSGYTM
jgi:hypothetical protein